METHAYLSTFFKSNPDSYYEIRKLITSCLNVSDIINIQVALGHKFTLKEFRESIEYSCFYKGVLIRSMGSPYWSCPASQQVDKRIYAQKEVKDEILRGVQQWINMISNGSSPLVSIFNVKCENSEFKYLLEIYVSTERDNQADGEVFIGQIWGMTTIQSKYQLGNVISNWPFSEFFEQGVSVSVPIPIEDKRQQRLFKLVESFCEAIVTPVKEFRDEFINTWKYIYDFYN